MGQLNPIIFYSNKNDPIGLASVFSSIKQHSISMLTKCLINSATNGFYEISELLIDNGAQDGGAIALTKALRYKKNDIVKLLIRKIKYKNLLEMIIEELDYNNIRMVMELEPPISERIFFKFILKGDSEMFKVASEFFDFSQNVLDNGLESACSYGCVDIANNLIKMGAIPTLNCYLAAKSVLIFEFLEKFKLDTSMIQSKLLFKAIDANNFLLCVYLIENLNYYITNEHFLESIFSSNEIIRLILKYGKIDIHHNNDEALLNAIRRNDSDIVELLLKNGSNPNAQFNLPIRTSIGMGSVLITEHLLNFGADANIAKKVNSRYGCKSKIYFCLNSIIDKYIQ